MRLAGAAGEGPEAVERAVEDVGVAAVGVGVVVLPDGLVSPAAGHGAGGAGPASEPEGVGVLEDLGVAGARLPEAQVGVDDGVAAGAGVVAVAEGLDPVDHGGLRDAVARRKAGVVLHVEGTGEGDAIGRPAAAVIDEPVSLGGAAGAVGAAKVVAATDQAGVGGASVVGRELGVLVAGTLSRLLC